MRAMSLRRLAALCCACAVLAAVVLCRVYWIGTDTAYAASAGGQSASLTELPQRRGDFYDRSGRPLTGTVPRWYALCIPGDASYATLFPYVPFAAQAELYERRNSVTPFLIEVDRDLTADGIYTYKGAQRTLPLPFAEHLLGYLNADGVGVSGLELAYEDVLSASGDRLAVACMTTAQGSLLTGTEPALQTQDPGTARGVRLTLDTDLQRACEAIADQDMPRGCIVVMETATGKILASVSRPGFDPRDPASSIAANDTSLIDRPLAAYSAGSVFKVVLALAAYRAGLDWFTHGCAGSVTVGDQEFRCAEGRAHGLVNLRGALEQSCNCYFIELGRILGGQRILDAAADLGFGAPAALAPGMKSAAGELPAAQALAGEQNGQLAMLSFGQGALTVTPLQITAMMNTVAGGGVYRPPQLVEGIVDEADGKLLEAYEMPDSTRVCSADLARVLRSMLVSVVEDGIGRQARPQAGGAGGKTGTAQTGQFTAEGQELLNYWFSGFWPQDSPQFTVTVLQDAILEPEISSAAIFARVADALCAYSENFTPETAIATPETG